MSNEVIEKILILLNNLEIAEKEVADAKGPKAEVTEFSSPVFNESFNDYVFTAKGQPASYDWLNEQIRLRRLPGVINAVMSAEPYSIPGNFMGEYDYYARLVNKNIEIFVKAEDADIYKDRIEARIEALKHDPYLIAQQKAKIKSDFLSAAAPDNIQSLFSLKSDLTERTPKDITTEATIALHLSKGFDEKTPMYDLLVFHALAPVFNALESPDILTIEDKQEYGLKAAEIFVQARRLGPTLEEMNIKI